MTRLQRRLAAHKRRKARAKFMKHMLDKMLKALLVTIVLPALIFYAANFRSSLSFFTNSTTESFYITEEPSLFQLSAMNIEEDVSLNIIGDDEIEVSEDATTEKQFFYVITKNGEEITDAWIYWSLAEELPGVSIHSKTGVVTVQSNAAAGVIVIQANVVGLNAFKSVNIVHPSVLLTVPQSIYEDTSQTVPESVYDNY